jgi:aspartokinase-like uncharacterized kinase
MIIRVIKVGGSLLDWPPLPSALQNWLSDQPAAFNVLVPGGGALTDAIRQADQHFSLGQETSHWLCIDALTVSAKLVAAIIPNARLIANYDQLRDETKTPRDAANIIFDPAEFLRHHDQHLPGTELPRNWSVTSDSIAARLAQTLSADELVLLKSCDPPTAFLSDLALAGYVDEHFPQIDLGRTNLRLINLRNHAESSALALRLGGKLR